MLGACLAALGTMTALAGVTVTSSAEPAVTKTVTWTCSEPATEFRYLEGTHGEGDFGLALPAGTESGSAEVTDNGNYTLYAKGEGFISYCVYPVTFIDRNSPDITIVDVSTAGDGRIDVEFRADDYFSSVEVRIADGEAGIAGFDSARPVSGNRVTGLDPGTYTLLARDRAGNVSTYTLHTGESRETGRETTVETSEWHAEGSDEWHGSEILLNRGTAGLRVRKVDGSTGLDIPDAKLTLIDKETGLVKDEWVTNGTPHAVADVIPGRTLILRESCFPRGYRRAADMEFTPAGGEELLIVMEDEPAGAPETTSPPETTAPPGTTAPPETTPGEPVPTVTQYGTRAAETPAGTGPALTEPSPGNGPKVGRVSARLDQEAVERLPQTGLDGTGRLRTAALAAVLAGLAGIAAINSKTGGKPDDGNKEDDHDGRGD